MWTKYDGSLSRNQQRKAHTNFTGKVFTARHPPNGIPGHTDMDLDGKHSEVNHTGSGLSTSFCVLPGIPTSGLSLCVFTESTPK